MIEHSSPSEENGEGTYSSLGGTTHISFLEEPETREDRILMTPSKVKRRPKSDQSGGGMEGGKVIPSNEHISSRGDLWAVSRISLIGEE